MSQNVLVGKTITSIDLAADRQAIKFTLSDGQQVVAQCDGDCCSHTWIEDVINPEAAIGAEVLSVEDIELPAEFQNPTKTGNGEDQMQFYGFEITTARGTFLLAYRNSSNGYLSFAIQRWVC